MTKKVIFLDIDGTIRNFDGTIPESTKQAVRAAREHGHEVCISTGRPLFQVRPDVLEIGFDGVISDSGGYVEYKGKCVRSACFEQNLFLELGEWLLSHRCIMELQRWDRNFVPVEVQKPYQMIIDGMIAAMGKGADDFVKHLAGYEPDWRSVTEVEKLLYFADGETTQLLREWDGRLHMTSFCIPNTALHGGEISPLHVYKREGMISIMQASGVAREDTIAVGDSDNDIDMLEYAAVGIAMGNGTPGAKAAADMVTGALMEDGLADAFTRLGL